MRWCCWATIKVRVHACKLMVVEIVLNRIVLQTTSSYCASIYMNACLRQPGGICPRSLLHLSRILYDFRPTAKTGENIYRPSVAFLYDGTGWRRVRLYPALTTAIDCWSPSSIVETFYLLDTPPLANIVSGLEFIGLTADVWNN